jgi:hypothetical protein
MQFLLMNLKVSSRTQPEPAGSRKLIAFVSTPSGFFLPTGI